MTTAYNQVATANPDGYFLLDPEPSYEQCQAFKRALDWFRSEPLVMCESWDDHIFVTWQAFKVIRTQFRRQRCVRCWALYYNP